MLAETENTTYSTSEDAISKLKAMKEKFEKHEVTGISHAVASAENKVEAVYGVAGVKRAALQNGVNIVKMIDGSFRKVLKK